MAKGSEGSPTDEVSGEEDITTIPSPKPETVSVSLRQRVCFGGRRGKKAAKPWRGRLKSRSASYCQFVEYLPSGPTVFSTLTLYDKQGYNFHQGIRKGPPADLAHIDLEGRLVNADSATCLKKVGGRLGEQESFVWEGLCPLQRVLVVAVAAAAASAAKDKNAEEVLGLQRVIRKRESALILMREELSKLLSQVDLQRSQLNNENRETGPLESLDDLVNILSQIDVQQSETISEERDTTFTKCVNETDDSSSTIVGIEGSEFVPEHDISPVVNRQLNFFDLTRKISPIKEESPISGGPGQELMEKMVMSNSWIEALDIGLLLEEQSEAQGRQFSAQSANEDVVFEHSELNESDRELEKDSTEQPKAVFRPQCGTWETGTNSAMDAIQDNASAVEWLSETSSVIMDPFSPMPSEKQHGIHSQETDECSKDWWRKSLTNEKSLVARARSASIILDIKKQVISLLDEAASNVLHALTFISQKTAQLEGPETSALTPKKPEEAWNTKSQASAAIKENVKKASMKIITLQTAMLQLWDSVGPEAMASLEISPSDFDDYLTNLQIAKILNDDASEMSTGSVSIQSWQEWFRRGFDNPEASFLRKIQVSGEKESDTPSETQTLGTLETMSQWPPSGSIYAGRKLKEELSPGNVAVRQKVEKLMLPLFENVEEIDSAEKSTDLVTVAEGLVSEFEKSAAKFSSLKNYVRACDMKRKQVEKKLLEAWEQDSKNQAKAGNEITELKRQVRIKEAAYQQLISSRKALVSSKSKEIAELREDCRRHNMTLQDMASAAKATQESSEKRLAMLEEICRKKDSSIMSLKQEIFELEGKVQELQACQTPAQLRPMNLPPADREADTESTDDIFDNENYRMFGDECQLRGSYQSMCGSENRRTSWGSDLSAQEFHIIDTPWSSELAGGQDFIEEAAFKGRSLSIFQNVDSSREFLRSSLRRLGTTPGGGLDTTSTGSGSTGSGAESRPTVNLHREARRENSNHISNTRKELSKSVTNLNLVTARSKNRDDRLRASTGVLSAVGPNTPVKPRRSTSVSKERSQSSFTASLNNASLNGANKPKENASRARQKWV